MPRKLRIVFQAIIEVVAVLVGTTTGHWIRPTESFDDGNKDDDDDDICNYFLLSVSYFNFTFYSLILLSFLSVSIRETDQRTRVIDSDPSRYSVLQDVYRYVLNQCVPQLRD